MINPGAEDMKSIAAFDTADFEKWLRIGLEGYLIEKHGVWDFNPLGVFLGGDDHIATGIARVFGVFPARQQVAFRQAVANLVANLEAGERYVEMLRHLLILARLVHATEILKVLPSVVRSDFFNRINDSINVSLFQWTFETVVELTNPTQGVVDCLHALIGSRNFDVAYSGLALVALCRAVPEKFIEHMEFMQRSLASMFAKYQLTEADKQLIARRVATAVGLFVLANWLPRIQLADPCDSATTLSDNWLFDSFFLGEKPILQFQHSKIIWHGKPEIAAPYDAQQAKIKLITPKREKESTPLPSSFAGAQPIANEGSKVLGAIFNHTVYAELQGMTTMSLRI